MSEIKALTVFISINENNMTRMGDKFSCIAFANSARAHAHAASHGRKVHKAILQYAQQDLSVAGAAQKVVTKEDVVATMLAMGGDAAVAESLWEKL